MPLKDGSNIVILGGGPAGSFFAIFALRLARELGRAVSIVIYDRKDFTDVGPQGCNMCAGAIGAGLVNHLKEVGIPLPPQVIRQEIKGYAFHGGGRSVYLRPPPEETIYTVFRGGGPPGPRCREVTSFDQHLLNYTEGLGARVIRQRVDDLELPKDPWGRVRIRSKFGWEEADLVVGAFGVNSALGKRLAFGYRPPRTWHTCQTEIEVERDFVRDRLKDMIHIFSTVGSGLHFLAITPKGTHLTVTGIGRHVRIRDLQREMRGPQVAELLPERWESICHCHPQVPVGQARQPYTDRMVIIGDASNCRYLKNGIESAFVTARQAAQTALCQGISRGDFYRYYYLPCRRIFSWDNEAGKLLFFLHRLMAKNRFLFRTSLDMVELEQRRERGRRLSNILWNMFTGNAPYRRILIQGFSPALAFDFLRCAFRLREG